MNLELGPRLKDARLKFGLSLRAVAREIGVSPSLLSQVENSKTSPSVATLYRLVTTYGVTMDSLLNESPLTDVPKATSGPLGNNVQRAQDAPSVKMSKGVLWERMADSAGGGVDPLLATYQPGSSSSDDYSLTGHSGLEYGVIIEGELNLTIGEQTTKLQVGDSFSFDSTLPHSYSNTTAQVARGVWFILN